MKLKKPVKIYPMNNRCKLISLALFVALILQFPVSASESEKLDVYMELSSWKYARDTRTLLASMTAEDESGKIPVVGVNVFFIILNDTEEIMLGSAISGDDGTAVLVLDPSAKLPFNEEAYMEFISRSEGNEKYMTTEAELAIKDAWIDISFVIEDSIKMIQYEGGVVDADGSETPLADDDIYLFVPRMFNLLPIEEGWLEEDGRGSMEFPLNLIGDSTGMIKVIARIEEHYDYGNLEASGEIGWALHKHAEIREGPKRALWTPIAPLWMIITLIIMLAGVWGHYVYAIIQLYKIKKAGNKN